MGPYTSDHLVRTEDCLGSCRVYSAPRRSSTATIRSINGMGMENPASSGLAERVCDCGNRFAARKALGEC